MDRILHVPFHLDPTNLKPPVSKQQHTPTIKHEPTNGRSEITLISRVGHTILTVTLPFLVDPARPDEARDLAVQHARAHGIDVSDYEAV